MEVEAEEEAFFKHFSLRRLLLITHSKKKKRNKMSYLNLLKMDTIPTGLKRLLYEIKNFFPLYALSRLGLETIRTRTFRTVEEKFYTNLFSRSIFTFVPY